MLLALSVIVLMGLKNMELRAQSDNQVCPCFSNEEIESIFLAGLGMTEDESIIDCKAMDYKVEFVAEEVVWDQNYDVVAQARVKWFDFDPGGCEYINNMADPAVERSARWPHPAPEATARTCFNIISNVIKTFDKDGICNIFP